MNIAKELNILLEEFKFKPRRLQNRDQARRENELKKLKQIQKENPIGSNLGYQNLGIKTIELPRIINGSLFVKVYNENYAEEYQKYLEMKYLPTLDIWEVSKSNVPLTEVKNSGWKGHYYKITSLEEYLNHYSVKDTLKQKSDGKLRKVDTIKEIEIFYSDKTGLFHLFNGKTLIGDFVLDPVNILGVNVNQISRIEIIPIFRGNKYAQVVYDFVIKHFGVIASSSEQTKDARKIWENMYEQGKYYILLYDTVKHTLENVKNENGLTGLVNPSSGKYKIYIACKKIPNPFLNLLNESFKFEPRRIKDRKEQKEERNKKLCDEQFESIRLKYPIGTKLEDLDNDEDYVTVEEPKIFPDYVIGVKAYDVRNGINSTFYLVYDFGTESWYDDRN